MKKLSFRGKMTITTIIFLMVGGLILCKLPNYDNYEVRTMRIYDRSKSATYLIDGTNNIYKVYDKISANRLNVTVDTKGTSDPKDDEIISYINK